MAAGYSHTTRASGSTLTATIYNNDHQNHINQTPATYDDYSVDSTQMQSVTDPGEVGTESLATSLAGELQRLRFMIKEITGEAQWYASANTTIKKIGGYTQVRRNSNLTIGTGSDTAITWDTEVRDDEAFWVVGSPTRLTAPYACLVACEFQLFLDVPVGASTHALNTFINGSATSPAGAAFETGVTISKMMRASGLYSLASGDYITCIYSQTSGGDLTLIGGAYSWATIRVIA